MPDDLGGFVPIDARTLQGLAASMEDARDAERALARTIEAALELTEDLGRDAVRGLRDRGASAAQIERYEAARRDAARATRERLNALREILDAIDEQVGTLTE